MRGKRIRTGMVGALALALILWSIVPLACGADEELRESAADAGAMTGAGEAARDGEAFDGADSAQSQVDESKAATPGTVDGAGESGGGQTLPGLSAAEKSLGRKVISNATLQVEVERGRFQDAFDRALLLADKYGGYIISSQATGAGDEGVIRSGTVAIRIPATSFTKALSEAGNLGKLRSRQVDSQDVTEEFVDIQARLTNAEAQEKTLRALLDRAKTIDEILQVRQVLASTQAEIEQLKGRLRFLEEHTNFSTITVSVFESGVEVASTGGWGFVQALRDAARGFVNTINGMIVALGEGLPVLVILAVLAWVAYRVLGPLVRRRSAS